MEARPDLLAIIIGVAAVGLIPFIVVSATAFLKIAVVLFLLRNALGTQQTPPNLVLYALAVALAAYVSLPLILAVQTQLSQPGTDLSTADGMLAAARSASEPVKAFLSRFADERERDFLLSAASRVWPQGSPGGSEVTASRDDLIVLLPAFVVSELTRAFEIGFLIYLPFIVIDLIVSNVLMAMGMVMVSPLVISVPFKLFVFVLADGWSRLTHGLVLSYALPGGG
ncbi:type III secretion system export apparatus subunit SctR [Roseomonas sp. CCTCC AB2023176]|uniref:type III secretion system export apparatus subunit SctR n=1 Tax=Roseomonas sp. CCTCC AB2023176 TaxID=3342640 RepID=UPI0035D8F96F